MQLINTDKVLPIQGPIDYQAFNPLSKLMDVVEKIQLAAERECYIPSKVQYLLPFDYLEMYPPSTVPPILDPRSQDNKEDFQKQNVAASLHRHQAGPGGRQWMIGPAPFLRVSYRGGPDTILSQAANHQLGSSIKVWLKVRDKSEMIVVPSKSAHR